MLIMSYNCRGLNPAKICYVKELLDQCDSLLVQEHWQLDNGIFRLQSTFSDNYVFATCAVVQDELLLGFSYDGCAILVNKRIQCTVKHIVTDCSRLCITFCNFNDYSVMLACVYMPCDTGKSNDEFDYVLSVISSLQLQFNTDYVIIGGDLNADLSRLQSSHTRSLIDYCKEHNLTCVNSMYQSIDYT